MSAPRDLAAEGRARLEEWKANAADRLRGHHCTCFSCDDAMRIARLVAAVEEALDLAAATTIAADMRTRVLAKLADR